MPKPNATPPEITCAISKQERLLSAVGSRSGASLKELEEITGWQAHSIRAALSRLRQRGHLVERTQTKTGARYRLRRA